MNRFKAENLFRGTSLAWLVIGFLCVFNLVPFMWMLSTSFKTLQESYALPPTLLPQNPTLSGYDRILVYGNFPLYFANSTIVGLSTALFSTFVGLLAGYGFSRFSFRGKTLLMGAILSSQMLPGVLLVGPYFKMLAALGLYDTRTGLVIAFTTITLPFSTWMLKGFIDTVPVELDEAAMVDGCSRLRAFFSVIFPAIAPGMVATIVFAFLLAWGDLLWCLALTTSESVATVTLGLARLVTQFRIEWPQLMAGSVVAAIPPVLLYLLLQNYLIKGLTGGAVKG
ncbi:carbohydrate ABC transporter permease [Candidatus Aerophobetes bacterium]|uniref:Carbohydrate ABC transporter permease n=1 Tax=Aerophobetes bacterium TaxID=2030807 RepID=A0A523QKG8_UNCAE|nr:MAG: carbohydrate ABC transporter permease [Candidatus Aerophobetes bacterium]